MIHYLSDAGNIIKSVEFFKIGDTITAANSNKSTINNSLVEDTITAANSNKSTIDIIGDMFSQTNSNTSTSTSNEIEDIISQIKSNTSTSDNSLVSSTNNTSDTTTEVINSTHNLYKNDFYNLRFIAPSDWSLEKGNDSLPLITLFSPDENSVAIIEPFVEKIPEELKDLTENLPATIDAYSNFSNFKVISSGTDALLDEKPAYYLEATYNDPDGGPQELRLIGTVLGNLDYSFRYISNVAEFSKYLPVFQSVVGTIQLEK